MINEGEEWNILRYAHDAKIAYFSKSDQWGIIVVQYVDKTLATIHKQCRVC
jgi:hypothetical protein